MTYDTGTKMVMVLAGKPKQKAEEGYESQQPRGTAEAGEKSDPFHITNFIHIYYKNIDCSCFK